MQEQVNFIDARPEALYSRPDGKFTIFEDDSTLRVIIAPEFAKMYDNYLASVQGGNKSTDEGGNSVWVIPKGRSAEAILGAAIQKNIAQMYRKPPPLSMNTLVGMLPIASSSGGAQTPPRTGDITYLNPYGQVQLPQQGQPGYIPTVQKAIPVTIYQDAHTRIQDYSDKAIAVFLSNQTYMEKGPYFETIGKKAKLYPDGQQAMAQFGYIISKSNEASMAAISQIIGKDVRQVANFSNITKEGGGHKWGGKPNNANLSSFMGGGGGSGGPLPLLPTNMVMDPSQVPGLTGNLPYIPETKTTENVEDVVKKMMSLNLSEPGRKEDEENVYLWGDKESIVLGEEDSQRIKFDCTMGGKRIVCYGKK